MNLGDAPSIDIQKYSIAIMAQSKMVELNYNFEIAMLWV